MNPPTFLTSSLLVALGGAVGTWLRYMTSRLWLSAIGPATFPWATLTVNVVGSFAMGLLAGWLARHGAASSLGGEGWRLLLGVGVLGGFTTFSAFSLELVTFIQRGQFGLGAAYALLSVAAGIAGLFAGLALTRGLA